MVVEVLGRWQNLRSDDGPRRGRLFRHREETEEETDDRLLMGEFEIP